MVKVKICGITNKKDAHAAATLGATALGFIFYKKSPRSITPAKARSIISGLSPFITPVGVFVNERLEVVKRTVDFCGLGAVQLHGDESPEFCKELSGYTLIKAFRVGKTLRTRDIGRYDVDAVLLDAHAYGLYGGSGTTFNWKILKNKKITKPIILSGGLNPQNIATAIKTVRPFAVDIASGVEKTPGKKDERRLRALFKAIHRAQ